MKLRLCDGQDISRRHERWDQQTRIWLAKITDHSIKAMVDCCAMFDEVARHSVIRGDNDFDFDWELVRSDAEDAVSQNYGIFG